MYTWLSASPTIPGSLLLFVAAFILDLAVQVLIGMTWTKVNGESEHPQKEAFEKVSRAIKQDNSQHLRLACMALAEEVIFRLFPVVAADLLGYDLQTKVIISAHSAAIFGYLHGTSWKLRLTTGSSGFIFSLFFLKLGGAQGDYLQALLWVWLLHGSINLLLITLKNEVTTNETA